MGVLGLWQILESVGHPIKLDGLEGKRLGVDANVWLYKFIRGFRDKDNNANMDSHKLGLFNRVSKLLFYRIKPVFVFDGPAPVLKRRTLERRHNLRSKHLMKVQDSAMRILAEQLKKQYPDAVLDDLKIQVPQFMSNGLVAAEKLTDEDASLFYLPPESEKKKSEDETSSDESNDQIETVQQLAGTSWHEDQHKVDVDSDQFKNLPPEVRYEVLQDIKEHKKRIRNSGTLPEDAGSFSNFQLERLKARRSVQEKIEECERDICSMYTGEYEEKSVSSYRVHSDPNSRMLYIQNQRKLPESQALSGSSSSQASVIPQKKEELAPVDMKSIFDLEKDQLSIREKISRSKTTSTNLSPNKTTIENTPMRLLAQQLRRRYEAKLGKLTPKVQFKSHGLLPDDDSTNEEPTYVSLSPEAHSDTSDTEIEEVEFLRPEKPKEVPTSTPSDAESPIRTPSPEVEQSLVRSPERASLPSATQKVAEGSPSVIVLTPEPQTGDRRLTIDLVSDSEEFVSISPEPKSNELENESTSTGAVSPILQANPTNEHGVEQALDNKETERNVEEPSEAKESRAEVTKELIALEMSDWEPSMTETKSAPEGVDVQAESNQESVVSNEKEEQQGYRNQVNASELVDRDAPTNRMATKVTTKIVEEAKELLRLFGVPYIDAAGEAEAQCALLEELKLTEGTITDDSDIWLFGAKNVYRYFFNDDKYAMQYKLNDIEYHLRLTRQDLVCFAMLVGSDYTDGIMNVGPVNALEIVSEFRGNGMEPLVRFKEWRDKHTKGTKVSVKRRKLLKFHLPEDFPSRAVFEGYMRPMADTSTEEFTWGTPELDELREYARRNFGWDPKRTDEKLVPVMKRLNERKTQPTIDTFFFKTQANLNPERFRSKRVNEALNKLANDNVVMLSEDDEDERKSEGEPEVDGKQRKGKRRKRATESEASKKQAKTKGPSGKSKPNTTNANKPKRQRRAKAT